MDEASVTYDLELVKLRRALHACAELADEEQQTAETVREFVARHAPTEIVTGLGGHGVAAVFDSGAPGPTAMLRAELDALPIAESIDVDHAARGEGVSHNRFRRWCR